ncbi:penicillin-binding transpeptidase domain-containing protein [Listeria ivanovii]|uniref:penicillin-binding protein PBP4(5) n=1 Tax=Listeria ivanovii TaxID=1638 RepID=UPI0005127103|nr:penicillin-binding transpeptidase domain-containing protein [Listeria ivanovii]AIS61666.1 penicillin-binding protein [Listeria ivanovii subsp. londoniensis]MBK1965896.1 penicillin-binding transpeptidase domain-containing protein [Listeria ivanovii subsp. londoniensis]MBK1984757.1 penicillin-binding transpeptidase domain-containing protein [Listeria ivanovii subsp. londoniensis]MBK1995470.1 penicillin-binding transpeptidase domain-containing protein [Listeria ivanovii subsp. londoniensis]
MANLNGKRSSNKKALIIGSIAVGVVLIGIAIYFFIQNQHKDERDALAAAETFTSNLAKEKYDKLGNNVTTASLRKVEVTAKEMEAKYQAVYGGIGAENIKVKNLKSVYDDNTNKFNLTYELEMRTSLGKLATQKYKTTISKQNDDWKIDWKPALIFPGMVKTDKVRITEDSATRGQIVDRNGTPLATKGQFSEAGIVPAKLGEGDEKTENIQAISKKLGISTEYINKQLEQKWVQADSFVPLVTLDEDKLPEATGLTYAQKELRTYPLNEATSHLIGYVGEVSAEDIEKNPKLGVGDVIGKSGLERYYDKQLRGKDGGEIKIINDQTKQEDTLQKIDRKDGEEIKLTIDAAVQKKAFDSLGSETGAVTMINPTNGELLALVSTPSYDANQMVLGITADDYAKYNDDKRLPFLARYANRYAPGSTFKTITATIGLDTGITKPDKVREISGLKWQKDSSWGKYFVTRVHDVPKVNMTDALVHSDNIYFAQEGLEIGKDKLTAGLKKFDFDKEYNLPFTMEPAQISNDGLNSDILLADTSYGQGELLMSPIQQAIAYSAIANNGKMPYPKLDTKEATGKSTQATEATSANQVKDALIKTVSDPAGTAHGLEIQGHNIAAKTGTAELKEKQGEDGLENGFVYAFDADNPDYLMVGMIENVKGRGGSGLVIDKLKPVIESMYK